MSAYHVKVALVSATGNHVRFVPGALAESMVERGIADEPPTTPGARVRQITLTRTASSSAQRIGEPTQGHIPGVRFTRWVTLGTSTRVLEHHPRCLWT